MHTHTHTNLHIRIYVRTYMHVCLYVHTDVHIQVHIITYHHTTATYLVQSRDRARVCLDAPAARPDELILSTRLEEAHLWYA